MCIRDSYLTADGYRPPDRVIAAIRDFPRPDSLTGARSWFGLVNQVAYAFAQAPIMAPVRELLKSGTKKIEWNGTLENMFAHSKQRIIKEIANGVKSFEPKLPTCLSTDWSRKGIGYF